MSLWLASIFPLQKILKLNQALINLYTNSSKNQNIYSDLKHELYALFKGIKYTKAFLKRTLEKLTKPVLSS